MLPSFIDHALQSQSRGAEAHQVALDQDRPIPQLISQLLNEGVGKELDTPALTNESDDFSALEVSVSEDVLEVSFISLQGQDLVRQLDQLVFKMISLVLKEGRATTGEEREEL